MRIKERADIKGLHPIFRGVLPYLERVCTQYEVDLVITCGLDGTHSAGSLHYYGRAIDIRIRDLTITQQENFFYEIQRELDLFFDVLLHKTHIHIEFNYA